MKVTNFFIFHSQKHEKAFKNLTKSSSKLNRRVDAKEMAWNALIKSADPYFS